MRLFLCFFFVFFSCKALNAQTWQPIGADDFKQASRDPAESLVSAIYHDTIFIAFHELYTNVLKVRKYDGNDWLDIPSPASGKFYPDDLLINGSGTLYLSYHNTLQRSVKKWDGNNWIDLTTAGIKAMCLDSSGIPYCVTNDSTTNYTLKQLTGSVWLTVSSVQMADPVIDVRLQLTPSGTPFIAFQKTPFEVNIVMYDGSTWNPLPLLYTNTVKSFSIDKTGTPYSSADGFVRKWNGFNWITVGQKLFNNNSHRITQISFDSLNTPYAILDSNYFYASIIEENNLQYIFPKRFDGSVWVDISADIMRGNTPGVVFNTLQHPVICYVEGFHGQKAGVKEWNGSSWIRKGSVGISGFETPESAISSNGTVYIAMADSNHRITVREISGSMWTTLPTISSMGATLEKIRVNSAGIPFVSFYTYPSQRYLHVSKFENGTWTNVGDSVSIYPYNYGSTDLLIDENDELYIEAPIPGHRRLSVKKLSGNLWVDVGQGQFSPINVASCAMAIHDGDIYTAFTYNLHASVMVYRNGAWGYVGNPEVSTGRADNISITIDTQGVIYVTYGAANGKIMVRKYDGVDWSTVGNQPISTGKGGRPKIYLDSQGLPYVFFRDDFAQSKATIKRFDGVNWLNLCSGFSAGAILGGSILIDHSKMISAYAASAFSDLFVRQLAVLPSIYITSDTNGICAGSSISFQATVAFTDSTPVYHWKINGSNVGTNSANFTSSSLSDGDTVSCTVTVGIANPVSVQSNSIIVHINNPQVSISSTSTALCPGAVTVFIAKLTPDSASGVSYQWYRNNNPVGTNSNSFSNSALTASDLIKCVISNTCGSDTSNIISLPAFAASISGAPCSGDPIVLSSNAALSSLVWKVDGIDTRTSYATWPTSVIVAGTGAAGTALTQLNNPSGIFVTGGGDLYIADGVNDRVLRFSQGATQGVVVAGGNGQGAALNQLNKPASVWLRGSDLYIADQNNHRVVKWTLGQGSGVLVAGGNGAGIAANQLNTPAGIYVAANGDLFIADQNNNRVQKWVTGATSGITVAGQATGQGGSALNRLSKPWGLYMEANGDLYVSDQLNHRIVKWATGAVSGVLVAAGNGAGANDNQLNRPAGIWRDVSGNTYIADALNSRIMRWRTGATAGELIGVANLSKPQGLCLNRQGNLFVAEQGVSNRVKKYTPRMDTAMIAFGTGSYSAVATSFSGCTSTAGTVSVQSSGIAASGTRTGEVINGDTVNYINGACKLLASAGDAPGGNGPGLTTVTVLKDGSIQTFNGKPYLQKHTDVQPASNGPGYVSLYLTQSDLNSYNNYVTANGLPYPLLPTNPSNTANISNIVVTQFQGAPSSGTNGPGGQYNNSAKLLIANSSISAVYTGSYWKVSFPVSGLSGGYFIHSGGAALQEEASGIETIETADADIRVYPNPASGVVYIESRNSIKAEVQLTDIAGKLLERKQMEDKASFDISMLPAGVYLIRYKDEGMTKTVKFVKE